MTYEEWKRIESTITMGDGNTIRIVACDGNPPRAPALWPDTTRVPPGKIATAWTGYEDEIVVMFADRAVIMKAENAREFAAGLLAAVESIP